MTYRNQPEAIEDDIERTRARIEARLESLSNDITPSRMIGKALGTNPNSTSETISALAAKAKTNPLSALMVGVGLAGLFFGSRDQQTLSSHSEYNDPQVHGFNDGATPEQRLAHNAAVLEAKARGAKTNTLAAASDLAESARTAASNLGERAAEAAEGVADFVKEQATSISATASETYNRASAGLSDAGSTASSSARRAASAMSEAPQKARAGSVDAVSWVKDNPVPASLMALAIGAATASLLTSRRSNGTSDSEEASRLLHEAAEMEANSASTAVQPEPYPVQRDMKKKSVRPKSRSVSQSATKVSSPGSKQAAPKKGPVGKTGSKVMGSSTSGSQTTSIAGSSKSTDARRSS